jgi:uncharacterized small protein (DUF1192 family)
MTETVSSANRGWVIARRVRTCRAVSISAAVGGLLGLMTGPVSALGLGEVVEQSSLGEPLRFAIPVLVNADDLAGDEVAPECFKLVPGESARAGELPQIAFGRATLERNAAGVRVVVTSNARASDPALSFTVQAGCRLKIRHEYTVLLDPPVIREPMAEAGVEASAPPRRATASVANTLAPSEAARTSSARPTAGSRRPVRADGAAGAKRPTSVTVSAKRNAPARTAAPATKDDTPRLSVSRSAQDQLDKRGGTDIAQGKSDEEIRHEVEAETVVLQRRIAELSATLERMQAELSDATAAREAAERTAKAAPPPPSGPDPWLVSLALGVAVLALAAVLVRSRQAARLVVPAFARMEAAPSEEAPTALGSGDLGAFDIPRAPVVTAATLAHNREADVRPDAEDSFDEDLLRYAEQTSAYSVLEREQPKVVASVVRDWGKPKVIAYLRELLVAPRKAARPFSREAVSDLIFLQALAMEHAGYGSDESPWQVELDGRRHRSA